MNDDENLFLAIEAKIAGWSPNYVIWDDVWIFGSVEEEQKKRFETHEIEFPK